MMDVPSFFFYFLTKDVRNNNNYKKKKIWVLSICVQLMSEGDLRERKQKYVH